MKERFIIYDIELYQYVFSISENKVIDYHSWCDEMKNAFKFESYEKAKKFISKHFPEGCYQIIKIYIK